jgi:DNA-binding protein HU-beta
MPAMRASDYLPQRKPSIAAHYIVRCPIVQPDRDRRAHYRLQQEEDMTKTEIAEQMAQDAGISKAVAETALRSCIDSITKSLKNGQEVTIVGFGDLIRIEASRVPRFKPGKALEDAVSR